ncbi:MAG: hypothetical protein FJZ47_17525 [Candidatus Tectomicrobia bacterium]|uniref:Uncharacterized protein n=1 Tax=Tectimicrobiota bacterium TaxID=2528274 RepID=A0A937W5I6_UNCTE|nr:hypothetical protein [Candidatus Tectomicrobia bacterium]
MQTLYKIWNDAIGCYFFNPQHAEQRVFLTVDDDTLWKIGKNAGFALPFPSREHTAQAFITAVRDELSGYGGWPFHKPRKDEYPHFLGFLAIQVLAVFKIGEDEKWSPNAYWPCLCALLGDKISPYMPLGLEPNRHQILWREGLAHWANDLQEGRLGTISLPPPVSQGGSRRDHVGLPKSQALLTAADLAKLPRFYHEVKLEVGEDVEETFLLEKAEPLLHKPSLFRSHARQVLSDLERRLLACGQIREHLQCGNWPDAIGTARLWLTLSDHGPQEVDGGLIIDGQVLPTVRLPDILGKAQPFYAPGKTFRSLHTWYYVMILEAFQGRWEERRHAKPGEAVVLLSPRGNLWRHYKHVCYYVASEEECNMTCYYADADAPPAVQGAISLRGLPQGWCALQFHVREELSATMPDWCHVWLYAPPLQLLGGLRLARQTWMVGAGPTVHVRDRNITTVYIDGYAYDVVNHRITPQQAPLLDQPGRHIIQLEHRPWLQFKVEQEDGLPERSIAGWILQGQEWPSLVWQAQPLDNLPGAALCLQGPVVSGQEKQGTALTSPLQRQWLELARQIQGKQVGRQPHTLRQTSNTSHPLICQMQQIVKPGVPWFARKTKG